MSSNAYNPNKQGWGFAAVVCLITAGLFFTARTIHARTYRHPRDPMNQQVYYERDAAKDKSGHSAAGEQHPAPPAASAHDSAMHKTPPAEKH